MLRVATSSVGKVSKIASVDPVLVAAGVVVATCAGRALKSFAFEIF